VAFGRANVWTGGMAGWEVLRVWSLLGSWCEFGLGTMVTGVQVLHFCRVVLWLYVGFLSYVVGQVRMGESEVWCLLGQFVRLAAAGWPINEYGCKRELGGWMVVLSTTLDCTFVIFINVVVL